MVSFSATPGAPQRVSHSRITAVNACGCSIGVQWPDSSISA
jgi:hypothetical protein